MPVDQAIFICNNSPIKNSGLLANVPAMPGLHYYYLFCGHWCPRTWGDTDHRSLTPNFPQEWVIRRDQSSKRIHLFFLNGTKAIKSLGLCKIFAWSYKNYNFKDIFQRQFYVGNDNPELLHFSIWGYFYSQPTPLS